MGIRKVRLTLGRLMAVIGVFALGLALTRLDAAPAVSVCVFAGCTWYLAVRRYGEALARRDPEAPPLASKQKARIAFCCIVGAALAIGLPDAAFLGGYHGYMKVIGELTVMHGAPPDLEPQHILGAAMVGIAAALSVASMMRRGHRSSAKVRVRPTIEQVASHRFIDDGPFALRRASAC